MAVTEDRPAPYAPPSAIIEIMKRYRERGLPFPVNAEVLQRIGVSESLIPRTLQALQTLDLINEAGNPTDTLEGLRLAPQAEYKKHLADWLKGAYAGIFLIVDPTKDDSVRIRDAFRGYNPVGQQDRMQTLFEGLCAEAGLLPPKTVALSAKSSSRSGGRATIKVTPSQAKPNKPTKPTLNAYGLPPALAGLMESLPSADAGWTAPDRAKFLKTFESVLDFSIPVVKEKKESAGE